MSTLPSPFPLGISPKGSVGNSVDAGEKGVVAGLVFRNFVNGETINVLPVSYAELRRITNQDGQARGLLRLLTMPIANARWDVLSQKEDSQILDSKGKTKDIVGKDSSKERDFIYENLFNVEHEGGMSTPFQDVVSMMALAIRDGFKAFEKVFQIDKQGRIVLRKLALRENDTVNIISDDHGDFDGFRQRCHFAGRLIDVTIPKDKALLYTFGKEESPLYGTPLFLPVYYHVEKKHKLYYISHVAYQMLAIPPRIGKTPGGTELGVKTKFLNDLATLGFNSAMTIPIDFEVEAFESSRSLADFMPLIEHHNTMAAKAVLGQFMDLSRSSTGRLAGEQQDIFVMGIVSVLRDIEKLFNNWVIPQLIDFNFASRAYPKLRARAFTDTDQEALHNVFTEIMTAAASHASPEFIAKIEKKMADRLDIKDIDYEEVEERMVQNAIDLQELALTPPPAPGALPQGGQPTNKNAKGKHKTKAGPGKGSGKEGNA